MTDEKRGTERAKPENYEAFRSGYNAGIYAQRNGGYDVDQAFATFEKHAAPCVGKTPSESLSDKFRRDGWSEENVERHAAMLRAESEKASGACAHPARSQHRFGDDTGNRVAAWCECCGSFRLEGYAQWHGVKLRTSKAPLDAEKVFKLNEALLAEARAYRARIQELEAMVERRMEGAQVEDDEVPQRVPSVRCAARDGDVQCSRLAGHAPIDCLFLPASPNACVSSAWEALQLAAERYTKAYDGPGTASDNEAQLKAAALAYAAGLRLSATSGKDT